MKLVSVIIVSWNARDYLRNCLKSIRETGASCVQEIIVVDNASRDGSPEMVQQEFPEVTLIQTGANLGFARANNLAMLSAKGHFFALVNSDVIVHPNCLQSLAKALEQNETIGLVGPKVIGGDGKLQRTIRNLPSVWNTLCRVFAIDRIFPNVQFFSGFEKTDKDHSAIAEVEVLSGCFLMARKDAVDKVGGMDEQFFFYGEDIDWCKRFKDQKWKLLFLPEASAIHFGGGSSANAPLRYSIEILRASLKYWRKHYGVTGKIICYLLVSVHHGLRLFIRALLRVAGLGASVESKYKLQEDFVCLRWLLTGKEML